jgi:hypothetical protein
MRNKALFAWFGVALFAGLASNAFAAPYPYYPANPYQTPYQVPMQAPMQQPANPMMARQYYRPYYNRPMQQRPAYNNVMPQRPAPAPAVANPIRTGPSVNAPNRPIAGNRMAPRPYNRGPYRGPGYRRGATPFESNFTPWSRRFWDELGEGGRNPFKDVEDWFDPDEPREGMANFWDDMINAPHEAGKMPGGWTAPSVSVPNPVDVQKEFQETGKQVPDEVRTQMDNINIQTW